MQIIRNLREVRALPDNQIRRAMEANAVLCHDNDEEIIAMMEEEFNGPVGGDWYVLEPSDDPHLFCLYDNYFIDLFSDEWSWCDSATRENGCYFVFWGVNNAGGPCLYVPDEPWLSIGFEN